MYTLAIPVRLSIEHGAHSSPSPSKVAVSAMSGITLDLPRYIDGWIRPDEPLVISHEHLSNVLDAAAVLYLSYRVDRMEVYEYEAEEKSNLLVELNWAKSPEDAFGLFSLGWEGETVYLGVEDPTLPASPQVPSSRALYNAGLLRFWSGNLYARILACRETEKAKKAVLELGRSIVQGREQSPLPQWLEALPPSAPGWNLIKNSVRYFRSHGVLNSLHSIGARNLFLLGENDEAVFSLYEKADDGDIPFRMKALCIRYEEADKARHAYDNFLSTYLPEPDADADFVESQPSPLLASLEDGWFGCKIHEGCIAAVFQAPEEKDAQTLLERLMVGINSER